MLLDKIVENKSNVELVLLSDVYPHVSGIVTEFDGEYIKLKNVCLFTGDSKNIKELLVPIVMVLFIKVLDNPEEQQMYKVYEEKKYMELK